jgi:hypothetical protein
MNQDPQGFRSSYTARSQYYEVTSMNVPQDQNHQDTRVNERTDDLAPITGLADSFTPSGVQNQRRESRNQLQQSKEAGKRPTTPPLKPRRPSIRGALKPRFKCPHCKNSYAQRQGLKRHIGEAHEPKICWYCGDFRWARPYLFKEHLKKHHGINPDEALEEIKVMTDGGTTITRYLPQRWDSLASANEGQHGSEAKLHPPISPPPAALKSPLIFRPTASLRGYKLQPEVKEPAYMKSKCGDARQFEAFNFTYARSLPFAEGRSQMTSDLDTGTCQQIWLGHAFLCP